mmetsp:Transcript_13661/g.24672  ORF Transcript_13661/g.24672 Transcript_13661/m.24672 type:complete len:360 (+) Transcript_13661:41-1120(+)|eukprot:CAMPEP_0197520490 /NCGR_PEP_ID=MMETSP1318-20131121/5845_1 /TAXON_ID=552666 /ORGANISM="Partenskyella glossopodia, Strain RCC365" /LENGTH=359 /DNA_ID=CAMNT_0043072095 /DNA_START=50 /DNA_END=1129 /DNA_ORIENTATION=-
MADTSSGSQQGVFSEGQEVEIVNLKSMPKYNGIIGKISGPMTNGRYPIKIEGRDKPFNLKPNNIAEIVYEVSRETESMFSMIERKIEIDRIINEFKLDPFAILGLPYNSTGSEIQKHFRKVSLRCHPDKCPPEMRERAETAFSKLQAAKASLTNAKKRLVVNEMVDRAKRRVLKAREDAKKRQEEAEKQSKQNEKVRKLTDAEKLLKLLARDKKEEEDRKRQQDILAEGGVDPLKEAEKEPQFHVQVRAMVKEMMIEREWRKIQLQKAANEAEKKAHEEKKEKVDSFKAAKKKEEDWENGRNTRVGSWRDFVKGKGKGKKKKKRKQLKAFKSGQKVEQRDGDRDYIKRIKTEKVKVKAL